MDMVSNNFKKNYRLRLFLPLVLFALILIGAFVVFEYRREKQFKAEQLDSSLQLFNIQIVESIDKGVSPDDFYKEHSDYFDGLRITILNDDGSVVFDSQGATANHSNRPEVVDALENGSGFTVRRLSESTNVEYFYSALYAGKYIVRSALPYSVKLRDLLRSDYHFLWFIAGLFLIIFVFAFYVRNLYFGLQKASQAVEDEHSKALHQEQEKIRIKKQLTNNINHELKTPVSALHGYLETVLVNKDMDESTRKSFIEKSFMQTERLENLLRDVSTITRLDEAGEMIEKESVCINTIVNEIIAEMVLRPADQRMRVNCDFKSDIIVQGNSSLLQSVFHNLVDNSLAYSGGRDIFINLVNETPTKYFFSFADNGIGVEERHLDYLFERFYRIDKGRSRKMGGTGLGLSIVKNAVLFHGGVISVRNRAGGGLEFLFSLAKQ